MNFPYMAPYALGTLTIWVEKNKPAGIGMNDRQFAWLCELNRHIKKDFNGIPISFIDAPKV